MSESKEDFETRAAEALIEESETEPTLEDVFIRSMVLLKTIQAPSLSGILPEELATKSASYLTELIKEYGEQLESARGEAAR